MSPTFIQEVNACLGEDVAKYVRNKRKGGNNNKKGSRYEDFFCAAKLSEIAAKCITENCQDWPELCEQSDSIIDDLLVKYLHSELYYQLKNVSRLSWHSGKHPLAKDFEYQHKLCLHKGINSYRMTLVVSKQALAQQMSNDLPLNIETYTNIELFPFSNGSINRLIAEHHPLRENLKYLTRVEDPTDDELEGAFGALLCALIAQNKVSCSKAIFKRGQQQSPQLLRLLPEQAEDFQCDPRFEETLARIGGLVWNLKRGFFTWSIQEFSGVLEYNCLSEDFTRFQQRVIQSSPSNFSEFWNQV